MDIAPVDQSSISHEPTSVTSDDAIVKEES